jgi:hypothetical protein
VAASRGAPERQFAGAASVARGGRPSQFRSTRLVNALAGVQNYLIALNCRIGGSAEVDRKARAFLFLGLAFINFFFFKTAGLHALGVLFLIFGIYLLATKSKLTNS